MMFAERINYISFWFLISKIKSQSDFYFYSLTFRARQFCFALTLCQAIIPYSSLAKPQSGFLPENIKFSRLLNQKADLLRFTSISTQMHQNVSENNDQFTRIL